MLAPCRLGERNARWFRSRAEHPQRPAAAALHRRAIGIVSLLAVVTLRQDFAGAAGGDASSFVTAGKSLVAVHDWTFLLGPGFIVGVGNGLILGWLMYRSGLVPRPMALLGLIAGPVLC